MVGPQPSHHLCRKERERGIEGQNKRERERERDVTVHTERTADSAIGAKDTFTHVSLIFQILIINILIVDKFFAQNQTEETEN